MKLLNRNLITIHPKQELLDWVKTVKPNLRGRDLDSFGGNWPGFLIEFEDQNTQCLCLDEYASTIVETVLAEYLYIERSNWPEKRDFELFSRWFSHEFHEGVIDLPSAPLLVSQE